MNTAQYEIARRQRNGSACRPFSEPLLIRAALSRNSWPYIPDYRWAHDGEERGRRTLTEGAACA